MLQRVTHGWERWAAALEHRVVHHRIRTGSSKRARARTCRANWVPNLEAAAPPSAAAALLSSRTSAMRLHRVSAACQRDGNIADTWEQPHKLDCAAALLSSRTRQRAGACRVLPKLWLWNRCVAVGRQGPSGARAISASATPMAMSWRLESSMDSRRRSAPVPVMARSPLFGPSCSTACCRVGSILK